MNIALLALLIILNGAFAMSEMALTASRKTRLQVMVESGENGANTALRLHNDPTTFLSTVQIGITSIGLLNGIIGEAAFAKPVSDWLVSVGVLSGAAASVTATVIVVATITFLTIVFGELVPKRIGQMHPEKVARLVARPMLWMSLIARPFVYLLGGTTKLTLRLFGLRDDAARSVTEEEITASLDEGLDAGVIEAYEHLMVRNVFRLDERRIASMMIPRAEVAWLDASATVDDVLSAIATDEHSRYPVCRGGLDEVLGVVTAQSLLQQVTADQEFSIVERLQAPVFVPETISGMELLEQFRASGSEIAFAVDEYGEVQGVITVHDVLEAITGEFNTAADPSSAVQREDGSWLLDGLVPMPELKDLFKFKVLPEEDRGRYHTLAGLIMLLLGRLPQIADSVDWGGWRFEVVDMDGKRVDKVLVTQLKPEDADQLSTPVIPSAELPK